MARLLDVYGYTYDDVLIRPQYSTVISRSDVDTSVEFLEGIILKVPVMSANMQTVNSVDLCVELYKCGGIATIDQFQNIEDQVELLKAVKKAGAKVACAVGIKGFQDRAEATIKNGADFIIMDTPHAHSKMTIDSIKTFKKKHTKINLVVGNIGTGDAARDLIAAGADGLKIGVGPGASCLTRVNTGAGSAQLTAVMEAYEVANEKGVSVIADGGIKTSGNFAKSIAAGGSAAYLGSMFTGTYESPSEMIEIDGKQYKVYFGSSSEEAKKLRFKKDRNYNEESNRHVEGAAGYVPYAGTVAELVSKLEMGLRSAMSYSGATTIKEFQQKTQFVTITNNGVNENGAHGLVSGV